jgi:hypothetical protein
LRGPFFKLNQNGRRKYLCKIPFIDKKSTKPSKKEKAGTKVSGIIA